MSTNKSFLPIFILKGLDMADLPERLKELRKQKKLTQKEIAEKLGIKQNSYSDWENGKSEPNVKTILMLAQELDSSIDYLLGASSINVNARDIIEQYNNSSMVEKLKIEQAMDTSAVYSILHRRLNFGTSYERLYKDELELGATKKEARELINKAKLSEKRYLERIQNENSLGNSNNLETTRSKSPETDDNEKY